MLAPLLALAIYGAVYIRVGGGYRFLPKKSANQATSGYLPFNTG
jgi:hypothetical protein